MEVADVDVSRTIIDEARRRGLANALVAEAGSLPFEEEAFDGCWADRSHVPGSFGRDRAGATHGRYAVAMGQSFDEMTTAERILYVQDLWDRIADHPADVEVTDAWKAELDRRLAAHRADPSAVIPWEQVKANLLARR